MRKDISNQQFDRLTAKEIVGKDKKDICGVVNVSAAIKLSCQLAPSVRAEFTVAGAYTKKQEPNASATSSNSLWNIIKEEIAGIPEDAKSVGEALVWLEEQYGKFHARHLYPCHNGYSTESIEYSRQLYE